MEIRLRRPSTGTVLGALALFVSLGGVGYSATGGTFILGRSNTAGLQSTLSASVKKKALWIRNPNVTAGATALGLDVAPGHAPFTVNSAAKVANLNADQLDGIDSSGFIQAGVNLNADQLDGIDSSGFIQGGGSMDGQVVDLSPNTIAFLGPAIGGLVRLRYTCPLALGGNGVLRIVNSSTSTANLFVDSGGANPDYFQLGSGGFVDYPAAAGGESFHIQMQGAPGVVTAVVGTVHRSGSNDCHAQALGFLAQ